jgi:hypothetical protein
MKENLKNALRNLLVRVREHTQPELPRKPDPFAEAANGIARAYTQALEAVARAAGATPATHTWITMNYENVEEGVMRRDFLVGSDELPLTPPIEIRYPCVELRRASPFSFYVVTVNNPPPAVASDL